MKELRTIQVLRRGDNTYPQHQERVVEIDEMQAPEGAIFMPDETQVCDWKPVEEGKG